MTRPSLAFAIVHDVLLIAHSADAPDDPTYDRLVSASIDLYARMQFSRAIAISEGGAPTAAQRHRFEMRVRDEIVAKFGSPRGRMAVVTRSAFTRAVVRASTLYEESWFGRAARGGEPSRMYRAFAPSEIAQAIAWIGVEPAKEGLILKELERLQKELG